MENQHRKIKGYRELNQSEIDLMNRVKSLGVELGDLVREFQEKEDIDRRWAEIGKTQLQQGLMALTRSVAKPGFF